MKKKFFIIVFFVFFSFITPNKSNAYSSDPKQFISEIVSEAKKILVEKNSKEFKTQELSEMALKTVDIKGIGYYTLGNYRKQLSDDQMETYSALFEKYFLKSFTSRLTDYSEPKIDVLSAEILNAKYTNLTSVLLVDVMKPEVKIECSV